VKVVGLSMKTTTIHVSRAEAGQPVAALLRDRLGISWSQARTLVRDGAVRLGASVCRQPTRCVRAGQTLHVFPASRERKRPETAKQAAPKSPPAHAPIVRYVDEHIVVVEKPAGLTTMRHAHEAAEFGERGKRFLPPTLADQLPGLLAAQGKRRRRVQAVHRLDRDTSGLVVFALTPEATRHLGTQFRQHTTERTYLALVRGQAKSERIESHLVADRGDGRRGSGPASREGQQAVTHVRVVEMLGAHTLVECRLETGRTHQVRIHLGERGTPICGEKLYDRPVHGAPLPDGSGARRLMLHAATLGIEHPATGRHVTWTAALPGDMEKLLAKLRTHG
jgi:23S rRNA pseudouridine1911/1915/1917 synthase